jgi:hypothetical protein
MKTFKTVTTQKITALVCDGCGLEAKADDYEYHEFISVNRRCGYGSIHGDGKQIDIDLCQQCFADMCGDSLRITEETDSSNDDNNDLKLVVKNILSKNKIADKTELMIALQRIDQLWDAQHLSAKGNELHQLADIICGYEKKDWNSFFEQTPLADDDFMPGRLDFKSTFSFDEEEAASGMLSSIPINKNFDETNNHLLECIILAQEKHPELRLGQLLANAITNTQSCTELFYIEDELFAEKIKSFY